MTETPETPENSTPEDGTPQTPIEAPPATPAPVEPAPAASSAPQTPDSEAVAPAGIVPPALTSPAPTSSAPTTPAPTTAAPITPAPTTPAPVADSTFVAGTSSVDAPVAPRPVGKPSPVYTPDGQPVPAAPPVAAATTPIAPAALGAPVNIGAPAAPTAPAASTAKGSSFKRPAPVVLVAALAIGALVGGISGAGVAYWSISNNNSTTTDAQSIPANITVNDPENATTITAVAASAGASVVTISASGSDASGTGSGVIISKDGYILTNTHVVTLEGAAADAKVSVQMSDGRLFDATIVGTDPIVDLAVIKIDGVSDLVPIEFADSAALNVGDTAIAIGAPLGLSNTVTNGIVSALNRSITIASSAVPEGTETEQAPEGDSGENPFDFWQFDTGEENTQSTASSTISVPVIQTDAAINPGNSGGALLNSAGALIGINVAIASAGESASGNIGVGFAVPSNLAKRVADEIIADGSASHGLLGASVLDVTEDADVTGSLTVGASVKEISDGGAAANAGLKVGDVITGINGLPITGKTDLTAQIRALAAGETATITYVRSGKTLSTDVTLGTL